MKQLLLLLIPFLSFAAEDGLSIINRKHIYIPPKLGKIAVGVKDNEFSILKEDTEIPVKYHNTNHLLRHITESGALNQFLNDGSIFVSQDNSGDYILTAKGKLKGGGPVFGWLAGMGVRAVGYGVPAATTVAGVVAAAPLILGGTTIAATTAGGAAITTTLVTSGGVAAGTLTTTVGVGAVSGIAITGTAAASTLTVGTGSIAVGLQLTAAGATATTTAITGAAAGTIGTALANPITTFGTVTGAAAYSTWIEGLAIGAQAAVTLMPWLP